MTYKLLPIHALILTMVAACGQPPENIAQETDPNQTSEQSVAHSDGSQTEVAATPSAQANYENDPLVNPPTLTQPFPDDNPGAADKDSTLIRSISGSPNTLNPVFGSSLYEGYITELLYDGLFSFDSDLNWFVNEETVESFEESEDHLVNILKMRPEMTWHDGHPFNAHDVAFSFEMIMDENVPVPAVRSGTDQIASVEAIDDLTIKYTHKAALPTNKWNMLFPILPKHIFGNAEARAANPSMKEGDYFTKYNLEEVVGSGPYKLVEWKKNDQVVIERWEDYHGTKPHIKRQIFKIQDNANSTLLMFKKGDLDEMRLTSQQFAKETNDEEFKKVGVKGLAPDWGYNYIGLNMDGSNPFFTDKKVRRAMAHAVNYDRLIDQLTYGLASQAYGIFHPDAWMFNDNIDLIKFDLKKSAQLLDEAGWLPNPDTGWREKNGVKFEFTLLIPQGSPTGEQVAAVYQQDLKSIGVSLKTHIMEWATFLTKVRNHEFEAETAGWGAGADPDTSWNLWHSEAYKDGRNYVGYSNERVDELFLLARHEFDHDKRAQYYAEIQEIIYEDQPYIFLWNKGITWAFNKRVRGVGFSPRGVFGFDPGVEAWWIPKDSKP